MSMNAVYKAMSDPTRRAILAMLRERPRTAGEIADGFALSKPSISHHLARLQEAALIYGERDGTTITYHLDLTVFEELVAAWMGFLKGEAHGPLDPSP